VGKKKDQRQAAMVSSGLQLPCLYSEGGGCNCRSEPADRENHSTADLNQQTGRIILMCDQLRAYALQPKPTNKNCIVHWAWLRGCHVYAMDGRLACTDGRASGWASDPDCKMDQLACKLPVGGRTSSWLRLPAPGSHAFRSGGFWHVYLFFLFKWSV
jgi:hypothetical protein